MEKKLKYNLEYADNGMIITQPEFDSIVVVEYEKDAKGKSIYENCAKELGKRNIGRFRPMQRRNQWKYPARQNLNRLGT